MNPKAFASIPACLLVIYLATSCAILPPAVPPSTGVATATETGKSETKAPESKTPPERFLDNGLASPAFSTMDPLTLNYLERFAKAVSTGDTDFLLSQGESWYEERLRPNLDDSSYLAYLYRIGPFSKDSPAGSGSIPRILPSEIRSVRFRAWNTNGPVLELGGTFGLADGKELPFIMDLLWKLDPPRIIGMEP